jgi:hypothetical protein
LSENDKKVRDKRGKRDKPLGQEQFSVFLSPCIAEALPQAGFSQNDKKVRGKRGKRGKPLGWDLSLFLRGPGIA